MQVSDIVLKCVGFLGKVTHQDDSGIQEVEHLGTGFFISVPAIVLGGRFMYFVTAKHVVKGLKSDLGYLMANKREGGSTIDIGIVQNKFWTHPSDPTADVAVAMAMPQVEDADIVPLAENMFLTKPFPKVIGIGSEVFMTGLFSPVSGNPLDRESAKASSVDPILRTGNLAMIPRSQIQTPYGYADVYLVEARSIGGLSGSPVFVRETVEFTNAKSNDGSEGRAHAYGVVRLLGLMHGHWDIRESDLNNPTPTPVTAGGVNMGIGIVVPAEKILETLHHPELVAFRDEANGRYLREATQNGD